VCLQGRTELKVGPGLEEGVQVGPLINEAARSEIDSLLEDAVARGATE
jgi:succinate-semialdehyde dehydrogenase / glutarate-semialdehyde dehydrogenase